MTLIRTQFYVSSGKLNAMHTLRSVRFGDCHYSDNYICNLSTDPVKAAEKAQDYFDRMKGKLEAPNHFVTLIAEPDSELFKTIKRLSVRQTQLIHTINSGFLPFGKYMGALISEVPDGYILFFADKLQADDNDPVMVALASACMGVALSRDLIAKRQAVRDERAAKAAASVFVGTVGARQNFELTINKVIAVQSQFGPSAVNIMEDANGNVVIYIGGSDLGAAGDKILIAATVKKHDVREGVQQTILQRPKLGKIAA